ncbi:MAG: hypothetical protein ABI811_11005 [Acidobacteriota bacterium]
MKTTLLCLTLLAAVPGSAATILFQDDFSTDTDGTPVAGLTNWNILNGTNVDVGDFGALCSPGASKCIDTQGSGGNPNADIQTKNSFALSPGFTYTFSFTMNSGANSSFLVTIGTAFSQLFPAGTADGAKSFQFTAGVQNAAIRITDQGPTDNVGVYIGNILTHLGPRHGTRCP